MNNILPLIFFVILSLISFLGCSSKEDDADNRASFNIAIINNSGSVFDCKYIEYNSEYYYQIGQLKYSDKTVKIYPGEVKELAAYPTYKDSGSCEVILMLNDRSKGIIFFRGDGIRVYKIKPGLLGASGPG